MVRMNFQFVGGVNRIVIERFAQNDGKLQTENPDRTFDPGFEILPRRCRSGGSPVPFSNGWMTVAAASDFQSRPAMFCGRPSLLVSSNSGSGITPRNLEHRRVNVRSRTENHFGTAEEPLVES